MIEFINIQKESENYFLILHHPLNENSQNCRIWIDGYSAKKLSPILKEKPYKDIYGDKYRYICFSYGGNKGDKYGEIYIEIRLDKKRLTRKAECSMFFIQNIKWLFDIESKDELNYILEH